jgi:uncharacterized protein YbaP (TraB family)
MGFLLWAGAPSLFAGDRHLLWSVASDRGRVTIMGSIHTLRQDAYPLPAPHEQAYANARALVFETDMARMNDPGVQARLMALGLYPEGESLEKNLSAEVYAALSDAMEQRGLPIGGFSRFRPWFCAFSLILLDLQRLGYNPEYGLDVHFFHRAQKDGKSVFHLEPVEAQMELLASLGETGQEESFILQSLQELDILGSMAFRLTEAWRTGDAAGLDDIMRMGFRGFPDLHDRLITQRNQQWLPAIEDLIRQGKQALVIVGAGHLVGPQGLVALLKERGHVLEQH